MTKSPRRKVPGAGALVDPYPKQGHILIVLSYTGADGKRKQPRHANGLPVKGSKKRAEEMLRELRRSFTPPKPNHRRN